MCGIVGIVEGEGHVQRREADLRRMLALIRHRGPDQFGVYCDEQVGLGSARLSIIDLGGGQQPISNEDDTLWIVFNGEVFNYLELRPELEARGHRFKTATDTEVILHLYEEYGPACLQRLNGQFAIAIWDSKKKSLFLARDRVGVRPLFYARTADRFLFGSEIKTLFFDRRIPAEIDPRALEQVFTFWSVLSPQTIFRNVFELPPGHYLQVHDGNLEIRSYWQLEFDSAEEMESWRHGRKTLAQYVEEFRDLLIEATRIRLRADVPVGVYLSGGLDSSTLAAIIRNCTSNRLDTFSIAFDDVNFDEGAFQRRMAQHLGTEHQVVQATHGDIGRVFPEMIWHTETPIMRTSPAPMFMLSKLVRDSNYKVVLTGEGADEFLGGYDIFKEAGVRRFWARQPDSLWRSLLLQRLYPDIAALRKSGPAFLAAFFKDQLQNVQAPWYSHYIRWRNNRRTCRFLLESGAGESGGVSPEYLEQVPIPHGFSRWEPLERAQYLEITIFLSHYLLSSQGDRVGMAHSIEGRFPFLDLRVMAYCSRLPTRLKLRGLKEKYLLKQVAREWLPEEILQRPKRPYRAPIHRSFFHPGAPDYVREILSSESIRATGLFRDGAVEHLTRKIDEGLPISETDDMALAGIISTQLVHSQFVKHFQCPPPLDQRDDVKVHIATLERP